MARIEKEPRTPPKQGHGLPGSNPSHNMVYNGEPLIRCPGCRTFVPIEPYVELVGDSPVLDCPACRGARDLVLEHSLN
jgi:hypothetical protein